MASQKKSSTFAIPVFIFLDANVPKIERDVIDWRLEVDGYHFAVVKFLDDFFEVPDSQVVLAVEKEVFNMDGPVCAQLIGKVQPILVFFTRDDNFSVDAESEFNKKSNPGCESEISFEKSRIHFKRPRLHKVTLKIIYIKIPEGEDSRRQALVKNMFSSLKGYLRKKAPAASKGGSFYRACCCVIMGLG